MKLLLTSAGFLNKEVAEVFVGLFNKPLDQVRVIFIPTASRNKNETKYVNLSRQELMDLGIKDITMLHLDRKVTSADVLEADAIYVCGGNTFYLLHKMRESGLDHILPNFQGVYVGVSAGSVVVGPNAEVSGPWDENDVQLSNTTGLGIVDFAVVPHFQRKDKTIVEDLKKHANYEIMELADNQAIFVIDGKRTLIG